MKTKKEGKKLKKKIKFSILKCPKCRKNNPAITIFSEGFLVVEKMIILKVGYPCCGYVRGYETSK